MVHALKEIRRVLTPSGVLVDFRPIGASWPLDIVSGEQHRLVAMVDRAPHIRDDSMCDQVMAQALREGWFVNERQKTFHFTAHWNSAMDVNAPVTIPDSVRAEAQTLLYSAGWNARIGIRFQNVISLYRKGQ